VNSNSVTLAILTNIAGDPEPFRRLFVHRLAHALRDHRRIVIHRQHHGSFEAQRSCNQNHGAY
jgi:hypothetical protein